MQHAGKTSEIGHSCFAMNIKGGRGFPGISLYNPIKWSQCLILITSKTNGKQLGRGHCVLVEWGSVEWGWLSAIVWENVRLREIERWLSRRKNRVKVNEWFLHWRQRSHCVIVTEWVKSRFIISLIQTALQAFCVFSTDSLVINTGRVHLLLFLLFNFFFSPLTRWS